jgi:Rod binding domain-containing protein
MPAPGAFSQSAGGVSPDKRDGQLKNACNEFESVMVSLFMKEGLNSAKKMGGDDEGKDNGCEAMKDFAMEQMTRFAAKQGAFGIGKMIYEKLKNRA